MKEPIFIETMRLTSSGLENIEYHQERVDRTMRNYGLASFDIKQYAGGKLPRQLPAVLCRCRVLYGIVEPEITVVPYSPLQRKVVRMVEADNVEYSFKYADRTDIQQIQASSGASDIIIVRHGLLTDSAIANLVFCNASGFYTPATPLLKGTAITRLIESGKVKPIAISPQDMQHFATVTFVNAMGELTYPISILNYSC